MCGISGYISEEQNDLKKEIIQKMTHLISHRGPDGEGLFIEDKIALGHRRLAILDLSIDGYQPMNFKDKYVIIFNGEIYNYIEIRDQLIKESYIFKSQSDTEVILAAYDMWGQDCVSHFNGMWSFAIYDRLRGIVFCSRDRFGVKPFYYTQEEGFFAFGSEIRQLLMLKKNIICNKSVLLDFIVTSIADHTHETFFKDIYKLSPGHNLIYSLEDRTFKIYQFYQIHKNSFFKNAKDDQSIINTFKNVFKDAVKIRLRSDVAVGTCLSGGLDSSSVATLASQIYSNTLAYKFSAITAVSEQMNNDESSYAQKIVENSDLKWLKTKPTYEDFVKTLPEVVQAQEEPFGSASICMQYFVMKIARENKIPVLLDGQGGDETLLGYEKYFTASFIADFKERGLISSVKALIDINQNNKKMGLTQICFYLLAGLSSSLRYSFYYFRHNYLKDFPKKPEHISQFSEFCFDIFNLQKLEIEKTNLPILLRYEDKNSMHHSIETRLPFLDYRSVEASLSLPIKFKINLGWTKWILRKMMVDEMPDAIVWRKNKFGFEAPENIWMKKHSHIINETIIASNLIKQISIHNKLKKKLASMDKRTKWRLYSIALWEKQFGVTL